MDKWQDKTEWKDLWLLTPEQVPLLSGMTDKGRLGFAIQLKFMEMYGRFPSSGKDVSMDVIQYLAQQLGLSGDLFSSYEPLDRQGLRHRQTIRKLLGYRPSANSDLRQLFDWLCAEVFPLDPKAHHAREAAFDWFREQRTEPPATAHLERVIRSATYHYEETLLSSIYNRLTDNHKSVINKLLPDKQKEINDDSDNKENIFSIIKKEPGKPSLDNILFVISQLTALDELGLNADFVRGIPPKFIEIYRQRCAVESVREIRRHPVSIRYPMIIMYCWRRRQQLTDALTEMLMQLIHNLGTRAEKKVDKKQFAAFKKVRGKAKLLFRMAEATADQPDGVIKEVVYPVVAQRTLQRLVKEFNTLGSDPELEVHESIRASYGAHYRRMLLPVLDQLDFQSGNHLYRPVIDAIHTIKVHRHSNQHYYAADDVPVDGVIQKKWRNIIMETGKQGEERINRINYEICVLRALRNSLRNKEIWVNGADRYRNPEEDLPADYSDNREHYYTLLGAPADGEVFIAQLKKTLRQWLETLNDGLPLNQKVSIRSQGKKRIRLSPLLPQEEPPNTLSLKREIGRRWTDLELIDMLKEVDLREKFSSLFRTSGSREVIDPETLQHRLLLCLFGLGTNVGLKRIASQQLGVSYEELRHIKRKFIQKDTLRSAIAQIVNGIFRIKQPTIWGNATTSCAADSRKFSAYDQNLMTEWHARYGGRGIMIYWHVDTNATCIYSQLRRCSSSEVAAMMEGVLRHCTDMEINHQYVDSHGQSEVAFAFSYVLGFDLLPRLKNIARQKLSICESGDAALYPALSSVLTKEINWELIRQQYDEIIKYTAALRTGTAEPEAILRRFTRNNAQHPTYKALAELGRAVKTIFLCRYLNDEGLRCEINSGLNVVENWNSANDFIFYGEHGEFTSNRPEEQEISMLALHLLQISLVYVNTLLIQEVLSEPAWRSKMTEADWRGLSPLIYNHVNPYGRIELDMSSRLKVAA
ncbi:Tn3 family transposase [Vibrio anguillarum]|uniref:Tn3 family transposase n=1 Tax=Vibrio anguillarum TaxID=55601 RepID=UPI000BB50961|nr:Tn3 family transposase [Vibrio anguillarum]ATC56509.1 Tn3 family transposase [Vibrio anguillarum]ATC57561.1 Tn3 family transposase [Vibrio anguillarum]MBF4252962.1 Tn3 family transposase [Vibrio anguillarum]MBF4389184.1 Tn3 family transposase [Vibrio anguillarum]MBF4404853.1 Tn3 family transposase [Vibrio anguillarum]